MILADADLDAGFLAGAAENGLLIV